MQNQMEGDHEVNFFQGKPLNGAEQNFKADVQAAVQKFQAAGGKLDWSKILAIVMAVLKALGGVN